jgi:hypothetical protein
MQVGEELAGRRLILVIGALFAAKAIALFAFSCYEVAHGALGADFAIFYQAWTLIARGDFNPDSTVTGQPFWKDHLAIAMWPLALGGLVTRSPLFLKAVQDAASAGADFIGALWTVDILRSAGLRRRTAWALLVAATVSLLFNPWTFYANAFDFHFYTIGALFLMASLWSFYKGNRLAGVLCALGICSGGDVNATYAVGVGATVAIADRRFWKEGLFIVVASVAIVVGMHAIGAGVGSSISEAYGYLTPGRRGSEPSVLSIARGMATHPVVVLRTLWDQRLRVYANLGPDGWIGYFSPWAIGPWSVLLLENLLHRGIAGIGPSRFALPGFQFAGGYSLLAPGATGVVIWLQRQFRNERIALVAAILLTINALGWAVAWLPGLSAAWVSVPVGLAGQIRRLDRSTGNDVQVLASQGIVGGVADRTFVEQFFGPWDYKVYSGRMRVVLTTYSGIQVATVEESAAAIAQLLESKRSQVISTSNDIWVIDYRPKDRTEQLPLGYRRGTLPAAAFPTDVGRRVLADDPSQNRLEVDGENLTGGFLLRNAYFRRPPGAYDVSLTLTAADPVVIEVRDASKNVLVVRKEFRSPSPRRLDLQVVLPYSGGDPLYDGIGPFVCPAWRSSPYDALEIRIWAPAHTRAQVSTLGVTGRDVEIQ